MKSTMITSVGNYTIVKLEKAGRIEWVACRDYNSSRAEGARWSSGVYFDSLGEAVAFAYSPEKMYLIIRELQNPWILIVLTLEKTVFSKSRNTLWATILWEKSKENYHGMDNDYRNTL